MLKCFKLRVRYKEDMRLANVGERFFDISFLLSVIFVFVYMCSSKRQKHDKMLKSKNMSFMSFIFSCFRKFLRLGHNMLNYNSLTLAENRVLCNSSEYKMLTLDSLYLAETMFYAVPS